MNSFFFLMNKSKRNRGEGVAEYWEEKQGCRFKMPESVNENYSHKAARMSEAHSLHGKAHR